MEMEIYIYLVMIGKSLHQVISLTLQALTFLTSMAGMRFWLFLFLAIVGFSSSETRSLTPSLHKSNRAPFMEIAKEALKVSMERQAERSFDELKRRSPGGPDPRHH